MRADVTVTLAGGRQNADSFRVSYVSDHAETARKVTERLASLYIEQNLRDRENQAESTSQFLDTQLQDAKTRLLEHEKKLEAYRKQHAGELPTQLQGNLQSIQSANLQLQALNESMNRALERRLLHGAADRGHRDHAAARGCRATGWGNGPGANQHTPASGRGTGPAGGASAVLHARPSRSASPLSEW